MSEEGVANLAPYSFFNCFSSNPPIMVFSANRRVRDNTTKDTLANVLLNKEVVVNVVNYDIVRQMALTSVEFESSVSEFAKSGLTPVDSEFVAPPAVLESPVNMECVVKDVITLGTHGGAGHLIICEMKVMHIDEAVLDGDRIDPHKIDLMGRMGRAYYVRASGQAVHSIYQDIKPGVIGYDALPEHIRQSDVLTGNEIAQLAAERDLPSKEALAQADVSSVDPTEIHKTISDLLGNDQSQQALVIAYAYAG
jgi:flavin reductase (DIM6/NTAB) family NADH-FMN oxidoreductase RutF